MGVSPSTKWTTKHYFQDPLLEVLTNDSTLECVAIIVYGSSDANVEKIANSSRAGLMVKAINPNGVIADVDGFGNNHVDFINFINEVGKAKIPIVATTYKGCNQFVVSSRYLTDNYVELDKAFLPYDSCIVGQNSCDQDNANTAVKMLKRKIIERKKENGNE